ncbi:LuxR C-terminal-related transcriptional regulator [Streptomyces sp. NBC_00203]|uniref:LuxR C-terminal-related transcriptional regulator n=1 Tax=Streptomyces sp. NBC_00203 TaxID=2975680 RepID=UPI00324AB006
MPTDGRSKLTGTHPHGVEDVCDAGLALYTRALREGRVPTENADPVPCLIDCGLLEPDIEDQRWLLPVAPAIALPRLLHVTANAVAQQRQREARLAEVFEPLMRIDGRHTAADTSPISVLSGMGRINRAITQAMTDAREELLAIQPYTGRNAAGLAESLGRDQALLERGGRIRTLYQHTLRHSPTVIARYEQLKGDVEARTLDEVTERLLVIDRTVAFIPASKDRTLALEVRNPALIAFFAITFERLWRLATPMYPEAVQQPTLNGITPRQRAIASLLIEGLTDAAIADRLGMNIRTARVHIAKLAATLGSESRAQLGYLIAESGILKQQEQRGQQEQPEEAE